MLTHWLQISAEPKPWLLLGGTLSRNSALLWMDSVCVGGSNSPIELVQNGHHRVQRVLDIFIKPCPGCRHTAQFGNQSLCSILRANFQSKSNFSSKHLPWELPESLISNFQVTEELELPAPGWNSTSCIDGPSSQFVVTSYFLPTWHGCQRMVDETVHNQISLNTEGLKCGISPVLNLIHPNPGFGFWEYGLGLVSLHFCSVYTSL